MKRFILGFQRRVWWPKWTPASSSCFMVTTATCLFPFVPTVGRCRTRVQGRPWVESGCGVVCQARGLPAGGSAYRELIDTRHVIPPEVHGSWARRRRRSGLRRWRSRGRPPRRRPRRASPRRLGAGRERPGHLRGGLVGCDDVAVSGPARHRHGHVGGPVDLGVGRRHRQIATGGDGHEPDVRRARPRGPARARRRSSPPAGGPRRRRGRCRRRGGHRPPGGRGCRSAWCGPRRRPWRGRNPCGGCRGW